MKNSAMVVQTGDKIKPPDKDVTLPNGIRVKHLTHSIVLANGNRVKLKEGNMLSLNGEFIRKNAATEPEVTAAPAPATLSASASVVPDMAPPKPGPTPAASPAFTYRTTAPVDGKLKGVVELRASGFNLFIVRAGNQRDWKLEKSEFGNSLVMENMATEDDVRSGLKSYIGKMLDFGVAGRNIHFVVSSGAALSETTRHIVKSLESLKYVVNIVTSEREGTLGLKAALPVPFADKSFMFDMGSANSKIAWRAGGQPHVEDTYGSKYYKKTCPTPP